MADFQLRATLVLDSISRSVRKERTSSSSSVASSTALTGDAVLPVTAEVILRAWRWPVCAVNEYLG